MKTARMLWAICAFVGGGCMPVDDRAGADDPPTLSTPTTLEAPAPAHAAIPAADPYADAWRAPQASIHRAAAPPQCADDAVEENDVRTDATPLNLMALNWGFATFDQPSGLRLCDGDDDWFEVDLESHGALHDQIRAWARPYLFLRVRIARVGLCGASCGEPTLPDSPENTLTVEVYAKDSGALITRHTSAGGNVWITHGDARYRENHLIRVVAPPTAHDYILRMDLREDLFEDECEC